MNRLKEISPQQQQRRAERDAAYNAILTASTIPKSTPRKRHRPTKASKVTVTRPDGSVKMQSAYKINDLRKIVKERQSITPSLRAYVLRRDRGTCRYCGTTSGPFEIDHVVPVALGGPTTKRNLVTACRDCNQRKGCNIWRPMRM